MVPVQTRSDSATISKLKAEIKRHEALERKLFEILVSVPIRKTTDIYEELWNYAEEQSGFIPEGEDFYDEV